MKDKTVAFHQKSMQPQILSFCLIQIVIYFLFLLATAIFLCCPGLVWVPPLPIENMLPPGATGVAAAPPNVGAAPAPNDGAPNAGGLVGAGAPNGVAVAGLAPKGLAFGAAEPAEGAPPN